MEAIKISDSTSFAKYFNTVRAVLEAPMMMIRWIVFLFVLGAVTDEIAFGQEVPFINDDPSVQQELDQDMFDFVAKTLGSAKLSPHMKCTLKTRTSRELRRFSDGEKWTDTLEVTYNTSGFESGQKVSFKIPMIAKYGLKKEANQWSGLGETVKIEMGDYYEHWLKFTHDGKGTIVNINIGNRLRVFPCQLNN